MSTHTHDPRPVVERALDEGEPPACAECQPVFADARAARDALLPPGTPSDAVWTRIEGRLQALAGVRVILSCTYCKDGLDRPQAVYCAACLAPHHEDCFAEHGRCSTPGCAEVEVVRSGPVQPARPPRHALLGRKRDDVGVRHVALGALVACFIVFVVASLGVSSYESPPRPAPVVQFQPAPQPTPRVLVTGTAASASLKCVDADVREVVAQLARLGEVDVIIDPALIGSVSTDIDEVHWLSILHAVVRTVGPFELVEQQGGLLRIVRRESIEQQVRPMLFRVEGLSAADAPALVRSVQLLIGEGEIEGALVTYLPASRALIVHATNPALLQVEALLRELTGADVIDFQPEPGEDGSSDRDDVEPPPADAR